MTIAVLSWGSHQTLINTLESYKRFGLDDKEKIIFFQEMSEEDINIARSYGYTWIGNVSNIGIAEAYRDLVQNATGEFFLFLENDWELIEYPQMQIAASQHLLNEGVDIIRLRHRANPGAPLWSRQFQGREMTRPTFLLESVHWTEPGVDYPDHVKLKNVQLQLGENTFLDQYFSVTYSMHANWTNNPTIAKTSWLRENILPHLEGDIEKALQPWWEQQNFVVAHAQGLFTHNRIDR